MSDSHMYPACPLCDSDKVVSRFVVDGFYINACHSCGVVFVANKMTPETLAGYYESAASDEFVYTSDNVTYLNHYYSALKREISRLTGKTSGTILDVGCSAGYFLDLMEGWDRHGIEISPREAEIARRKYGDSIFTGIIEDYAGREGFFDVIALQDVLDHCIDPMRVVRACHHMLKPGGLIIVKVHDISCIYARITGKSFYAILPPFHLFYFSKKPLAWMLEQSGFRKPVFRHIGQVIQLKTVFYRLSRGGKQRLWYRIYETLARTKIGRLPIPKNLHDIITVIAVK